MFDLANRLTTTIAGRVTNDYTYDGDGKRLTSSAKGAVTTRFGWDINHPLPEIATETSATNEVLRRYIHGHDTISMTTGGADYYFHRDNTADISDLTSATGAAQYAYSYEPFGAARTEQKIANKAPANRLRFSGEYLNPDNNLYHLRARDYDTKTGRFTSADPVLAPIGDPYVAAYVYGANNPNIYADPSGEWPEWLDSAVNKFDETTAGWAAKVPSGGVVDAVLEGTVRFGDELTFGLSRRARHAAGLGDAVNECSGGYRSHIPMIASIVFPAPGGKGKLAAKLAKLKPAWLRLGGRGTLAARGAGSAAKTRVALVEASKYDYLLGKVASNTHNAARSAQNAQQLARVGVHNNAAGRSLLSSHFDDVIARNDNIARTFSNKHGTFQIRDSLFSGPGGFLKLESTWQVTDDGLRLTTVIPMGGP